MTLNPYFEFFSSFEKNQNFNKIEEIKLNEIDTFITKEYCEDIFFAFRENLSLAFSYFTKFSNFFGTKKNLEFHLILHLFNILLRNNSENSTVLQIANLLNRFCLTNSNFSTKKFNLSTIKECILLTKILFLPEDLKLSSIENFCNFLAFFISNSEFNFDFEKLFLPIESIKNSNLEFFRFYLVSKLCALSSVSKISSVITNEELKKYLPKENKPNWK